MKHLSDEERALLVDRIVTGLVDRGENVTESPWLAQLIVKVSRRSPRHVEDIKIRLAFEEAGDEPPDWSPRDDGWYSNVCDWTIDEMIAVRTKEDFIAIEKVVVLKNEDSFNDIIDRLNRQLKIKGMLYNRGVNPEEEYPKLLSKIWEAMSKWDGRDFTAYIARTIKNYCIDQLKARKKAFSEMPDTVADVRPASRTQDQAEAKDALGHILDSIADLEDKGVIGPLDGAVFSLVLAGRGVTQLVQQLNEGTTVTAVTRAFEALGVKKKISSSGALTLRYLIQGLKPKEVASLCDHSKSELETAAQALAKEKDIKLATALCRGGLSMNELGRATKITTNAINLRVNRLRLKIWQNLCDRAYDVLRKRANNLTTIDKAIVQHRCDAQNNPPCKMYKDRSCKREASLETIISRAGLSLTPDQLEDHMSSLRDKIIDDLGRIFPDYNACLFERKGSS
jgi:hypothetical protein